MLSSPTSRTMLGMLRRCNGSRGMQASPCLQWSFLSSPHAMHSPSRHWRLLHMRPLLSQSSRNTLLRQPPRNRHHLSTPSQGSNGSGRSSMVLSETMDPSSSGALSYPPGSFLPFRGAFRPPTPFQAFVKPVLFTTVASAGAFAVAAYVWERNQVTLIKRIQAWRARAKNDRPTAGEFVQLQTEILQERWARVLERFRWIQEIGVPLEVQKAIWMLRQRWVELTPGERTIWGIIGINSIVFAAWQIPRLGPFMEKWFMHSPNSGRSITLLTSVFSHHHLWHFGLNMFALYSFGASLHDHMGREQFLAFYLTTGMTASLVSHLFTVAGRTAWLAMVPSLGASGALFGCVSATAYMHPDASVFLIFLPFFPIKIPFALGAMMGLDLVGILRGWRTFDHYAHLAGATFGLAYLYGGQTHIWNRCQQWAIDYNKDADKFARLTPNPHRHATSEPSSSPQETQGSAWDKTKSWWNQRRGGGSKD